MRQPNKRCLTTRSAKVNALYSGGVRICSTDTAYQMGLRSSTRCNAFIARAVTRGLNGRGKSVDGATLGTTFISPANWAGLHLDSATKFVAVPCGMSTMRLARPHRSLATFGG